MFAKRPIKVIVGGNDSQYYVHRGALEAHPAFEEKLKSSTDNFENNVDWCTFDEQTVECVLSFLYTGDYQVPKKPAVVAEGIEEDADAGEEAPAEEEGEEEEEEVVENIEEAEEGGEEGTANQSLMPLQHPMKLTSKTQLEPISPSSTNPPSPAYSESDPNDRPLTPLENCCGVDLPEYALAKTPETEADEESAPEAEESSAAEIYLHTKIYSFACQLDFFKLKYFSLNRLAKALVGLEQTNKDLFPYLADGIRLIYTTTETTDATGADDARNLLSQFVAFKYTTLISEEFDKLIAEGGEFMVDVSRKLARKLVSLSNASEEKIEELLRMNEVLEKSLYESNQRVEKVTAEVRRNLPAQKYQAFTYEI
jgi:hypothetical protein